MEWEASGGIAGPTSGDYGGSFGTGTPYPNSIQAGTYSSRIDCMDSNNHLVTSLYGNAISVTEPQLSLTLSSTRLSLGDTLTVSGLPCPALYPGTAFIGGLLKRQSRRGRSVKTQPRSVPLNPDGSWPPMQFKPTAADLNATSLAAAVYCESADHPDLYWYAQSSITIAASQEQCGNTSCLP